MTPNDLDKDARIDMYSKLFNCDVSIHKSIEGYRVSLHFDVPKEDVKDPVKLGSLIIDSSPFGRDTRSKLEAAYRFETIKEIKDKMFFTATGIKE